MRVAMVVAMLVLGVLVGACGKEDTASQHSQSNPPAGGCCRVCSTGKACGDTCISVSNECHTSPGCACNVG